jgi:hypothetical protein
LVSKKEGGNMSEFSGKCDVCDCLRDRSDEYLQNSKFFIYGTDHRDHQLVINNQKDLAKYYPYLTCSMGADKNGAHVYITSQSFIDTNGDGVVDKETITTTFVAYAPYDNPKVTFTIISPDVSRSDGLTPYQSSINKRLAQQISKKYFEIVG